jgi:hypothetical protein
MKVRKQNRKIPLHRETIRSLESPSDLRKANAGAKSSLCTHTHPHCDTVNPCIRTFITC